MLGRKIQRGLPLLSRGKAHINEQLLNERDAKAKLCSKFHEDKRRNAKPCNVQPGDTVIVERHLKSKGDTRFNTERYTVVQEDNGSLLLKDEHGNLLRRHVTQTKRVRAWRNVEATVTETENHREPQNENNIGRTTRKRRAPGHLADYVRMAEEGSLYFVKSHP